MQNLRLLEYSAKAFQDHVYHYQSLEVPVKTVLPGLPSIDNIVHDTGKLLLNIQVS